METHNFTLILDGAVDEATAEELFAAGFADAGIGGMDGDSYLDVDREANSLMDAIVTAIRQLRSVDGVEVVRVDGDDLVSQTDIADRIGKTRQAVNHWIKRDADRSGFPAPAFGARTRSPLWRWADVAAWLGISDELRERDRVIALVNAVLLAHTYARDEREREAMGAMLLAG